MTNFIFLSALLFISGIFYKNKKHIKYRELSLLPLAIAIEVLIKAILENTTVFESFKSLVLMVNGLRYPEYGFYVCSLLFCFCAGMMLRQEINKHLRRELVGREKATRLTPND